MANPLFKAMMGGQGGNAPAPQMNMLDAMRQLQADPAGLVKQAGFQIPEGIGNNPQAMVMHLIQSGQVGNPMMRMIQPMLNRLGVR